MKEVVVASGVRTPIGAYCGMLRDFPVEKLAAFALNEAIKRANVKSEEVENVIMAQAYQNGEAANLARMALLEAGWPVSIPAFTLDMRCCSGAQSVWSAAMFIQTENAEIVVASGTDSMSRAELYISGEYMKWGLGGKTDPKWGFFPRSHGSLSLWGIPLYDRIQRARPMSQPISRFGELNSMMTWAEAAAKQEGISREEADKWSLRSHQKAVAATDSGKFKQEIVPIPIPERDKQVMRDTDETPRRDTSLEQLARLRPVYSDGVCTAGNSSSENDGAAAVVLMTPEKAREHKVKPLAYLVSFASAGADPTLTYPAVPIAVNRALKKAGLTIHDMDLIEIQEAFAVQTLADAKLMGIRKEDIDNKVNVNGSGISLGHPIGATGVMRLITLMHEMARRNARYGLLTICGGGGLGICIIVERR